MKSRRRLIRDSAGSTLDLPVVRPGQTLTRARPLRRRAARTARPALVRMRSRKPWVLARRRLFGWDVRLLTGELPVRCLRFPATTGGRARSRAAELPGGTRAVHRTRAGPPRAHQAAHFAGW